MEKELWNGFEIEKFEFQGREAVIVYPEKPNGKLLLKTEYWHAFPETEVALVKHGYYDCYVKHNNRWATPDEVTLMADFVKFVAAKLGIEPKCIPVGMSCGGLYAARLAQCYPELVSCMYIDAPVMNLISMAGLGTLEAYVDIFWGEMVKAHGFTKASIVTYRDSPIDHMDVLLNNNIPIIMVYGEADTTVIYEENGKILEDYYTKNGGILKVISKPGCEHHPHGLEDPTPVVEFIDKYC